VERATRVQEVMMRALSGELHCSARRRLSGSMPGPCGGAEKFERNGCHALFDRRRRCRPPAGARRGGGAGPPVVSGGISGLQCAPFYEIARRAHGVTCPKAGSRTRWQFAGSLERPRPPAAGHRPMAALYRKRTNHSLNGTGRFTCQRPDDWRGHGPPRVPATLIQRRRRLIAAVNASILPLGQTAACSVADRSPPGVRAAAPRAPTDAS